MNWKCLGIGLSVFFLTGCGGSSTFDFTPAPLPGGSQTPPAISQVMSKPAYKDAIWGLRVVDADSGKVLIDQNPNHSFYIGSVRKIFTVGLLLNEVGSGYTFDTPVYSRGELSGDGVLEGDLILVASGDLTMGGRLNPDGTLSVPDHDHNEANSLGNAVLSSADPIAGYRRLARQVAGRGISKVTGDVVIDDRLFQPFDFRGEFDVRPIFVNDNVVDLSLSPGAVGQMASLVVRPLSSALAIFNSVTTTGAGSEFEVVFDSQPDNIGSPGASVEVSGSLPVDFKPEFTQSFPLVRTVRITEPSNFARTVFVEALEEAGVEVEADTVKENPVGILPAKESYLEGDRVAFLQGTTYGELARYILKISYNIGADTSLVLFGLTQGVDSMSGALVVERERLVNSFGLQERSFQFVDGSGGGETKASNQTVTDMLLRLLRAPEAATFVEALPVLGVDGSLASVSNFLSVESLAGAKGQVRAKTGTYAVGAPDSDSAILKGQAFAGVIQARSGRRLAYELVVNNVEVASISDILNVFEDQGTISAILWRDY